ncbi:MAG: hypothetical protein CML22_04060 [Rheinheimera sp.]|nr:hypothetical protein [Rheinheimera sp.]MBM33452.1 hypothetical protein [Rheinheimera sp.]HAW91816.1 hypothetical protein [Candidatus Azambacteria bacterium]
MFLGNYLKEKFPDVKVDYVKGTDSNSSIHFWLEVEGKVYDITADQFDEFDAPLWNADRHPLEAIYSDLERKDIVTAFVTSDVTTETYKHSLMIEIENYLESKR